MIAPGRSSLPPPFRRVGHAVATRGAALALLVLSTAACAPKPLYYWGTYEDSLQASYVTHDRAQALAALESTLAAAQQAGGRVPPGLYAEYGFLLYQGGQHERAISFFQQEAVLYPESKPLMDKLTAKVRAQDAAKPAPPPGGDAMP